MIEYSQFLKVKLPVLFFLEGKYWKSCFLVLAWQLGLYFLVLLSKKAIRVRIGPVENSAVAELGNTHNQKSTTRRVKFQYYKF